MQLITLFKTWRSQHRCSVLLTVGGYYWQLVHLLRHQLTLPAYTVWLPRPSVSPEGLWEGTHTPDTTCVSYLEKYQNSLKVLIITFTTFPLLFQPSLLLLGRSRTALDCMTPIYLPSFTPGNWFRHVFLQRGPFLLQQKYVEDPLIKMIFFTNKIALRELHSYTL